MSGLVFTGSLTAPEQLAGVWAQAGTEPVRTLDLTATGCTDEVLTALANSPRAGQITALVLDGNPVTADGLRALQPPGNLPALTALSLCDTRIGDDGALELALLDRPLRELRLDGAGLGADGLEVLLTAPWVEGLAVLTLAQRNGAPSPGLGFAKLVAAADLRALRHLDLSGCPAGEFSARALADAAHLGTLTHLDLSRALLDNRAAGALVSSPVVAGLRTLLLADNRLLSGGARSLAGSRHLRALRRLDVRGNHLGEHGVMALLRSTTLVDLVELNCDWDLVGLDDWHIVQARFPDLPLPDRVREYHGDDPAMITSAVAEARTSRQVSLHRVGIGPRAQRVLRSHPGLADVQRLVLHHNRLGDDGARAIAQSTVLNGLVHLELVGNRIGPTGLRALVDSPVLDPVVRLDLSHNVLTVEGMEILAAARLPSLRTLSLRGVRPGDVGALLRMAALDRLELLDLGDNGLLDEDREYYDWAGGPVDRAGADPATVELRWRLGVRLRL